MAELTEAGQQALEATAARHGVSREAVLVLLRALAAGGGAMAQFSHPELGGLGQWSAAGTTSGTTSGMTMIGDMFDGALRARVEALCLEVAGLLRDSSPFLPAAAPRLGGGGWWPAELGAPSASGGQDDMEYAVFPAARRLAMRQAGKVRVFETGEHRIGGVSQRQGGGQVVRFGAGGGEIGLEVLREVGAPIRATAEGDPLALIGRLAELHRQGVLTAAEFQAKKAELLGRL